MVVRVGYITLEEFREELKRELAREGVTIEEFRADGEADLLTDGRLRDLWLHYRHELFDE